MSHTRKTQFIEALEDLLADLVNHSITPSEGELAYLNVNYKEQNDKLLNILRAQTASFNVHELKKHIQHWVKSSGEAYRLYLKEHSDRNRHFENLLTLLDLEDLIADPALDVREEKKEEPEVKRTTGVKRTEEENKVAEGKEQAVTKEVKKELFSPKKEISADPEHKIDREFVALTRALKRKPSPANFYNLGEWHFKKGEFAEAKECYDHVISLFSLPEKSSPKPSSSASSTSDQTIIARAHNRLGEMHEHGYGLPPERTKIHPKNLSQLKSYQHYKNAAELDLILGKCNLLNLITWTFSEANTGRPVILSNTQEVYDLYSDYSIHIQSVFKLCRKTRSDSSNVAYYVGKTCSLISQKSWLHHIFKIDFFQSAYAEYSEPPSKIDDFSKFASWHYKQFINPTAMIAEAEHYLDPALYHRTSNLLKEMDEPVLLLLGAFRYSIYVTERRTVIERLEKIKEKVKPYGKESKYQSEIFRINFYINLFKFMEAKDEDSKNKAACELYLLAHEDYYHFCYFLSIENPELQHALVEKIDPRRRSFGTSFHLESSGTRFFLQTTVLSNEMSRRAEAKRQIPGYQNAGDAIISGILDYADKSENQILYDQLKNAFYILYQLCSEASTQFSRKETQKDNQFLWFFDPIENDRLINHIEAHSELPTSEKVNQVVKFLRNRILFVDSKKLDETITTKKLKAYLRYKEECNRILREFVPIEKMLSLLDSGIHPHPQILETEVTFDELISEDQALHALKAIHSARDHLRELALSTRLEWKTDLDNLKNQIDHIDTLFKENGLEAKTESKETAPIISPINYLHDLLKGITRLQQKAEVERERLSMATSSLVAGPTSSSTSTEGSVSASSALGFFAASSSSSISATPATLTELNDFLGACETLLESVPEVLIQHFQVKLSEAERTPCRRP